MKKTVKINDKVFKVPENMSKKSIVNLFNQYRSGVIIACEYCWKIDICIFSHWTKNECDPFFQSQRYDSADNFYK